MAIKIGDTCKRGHKIEGDNVQHYLNRGNPHIRCRECNLPPMKKKQVGDLCKAGHEIVGHNVLRRTVRGVETIACRTCSLEASRRYRRSEKYLKNPKYIKDPERAKAIRNQVDYGLYGRAGVPYADIVKREDALDAKILRNPQADGLVEQLINLDMNKRSRDAMRGLAEAMVDDDPKCTGKEAIYIDYEIEPSMHEAYVLCLGCPLLVECGRLANSFGPDHGVWAGEVWKQGRAKKSDG